MMKIKKVTEMFNTFKSIIIINNKKKYNKTSFE